MASDTLLKKHSRTSTPTASTPTHTGTSQLDRSRNGKYNEPENDEEVKYSNRPRQKTLDTLTPLLHILERFHHRNKNQHRLSKWWSQADMLRRHLRKLIESLYDGLEEEERNAARLSRGVPLPKKKKSTKRSSGLGGDKEGNGTEIDKFGIFERAVYLRSILVPRAYLAFSQVTADRQFAHLGLMLLATLAQVDKAVAEFAPDGCVPGLGEFEEGTGNDLASSTPGQAQGKISEQPRDGYSPIVRGENKGEEDTGVAISREEFLARTAAITTSVLSAETTTRKREVKGWNDEDDVDKMDLDMEPAMSTAKQVKKTITTAKTIKYVGLEEEDEEEEEEETTESMTTTTKKKKKRPRDEDEDDHDNGKLTADDIGSVEINDDVGSYFDHLISLHSKKKKKKSRISPLDTAEDTSLSSTSQAQAKAQVQTKPKRETSLTETKTTATTSSTTTTSTTAATVIKDKEKKKKKKKKQGEDEFDDIFGGLL